MSETNETSPAAPTETDDTKTATDETNALSETADPNAQDPDDEADIIEPPDPGFVAPSD